MDAFNFALKTTFLDPHLICARFGLPSLRAVLLVFRDALGVGDVGIAGEVLNIIIKNIT